MDTSDYIAQCLEHLTDSNIYKQARYSEEHVQEQLAYTRGLKFQVTTNRAR